MHSPLQLNFTLTVPQDEFVFSPAKYPAMISGYGAGKSYALIVRLLLKFFSHRGWVALYYPTFDLCRMIGFHRIVELFDGLGLQYSTNKQEMFIEVQRYGRIYFRSLDHPERIVGFEVWASFIDEFDILTKDKAKTCWKRIVARNRQKAPEGETNTIAVASTPEGFGFCYEKWGNDPKPGYHLIRASTHSNAANLPDDYITTLELEYPTAQLQAYLMGEFVNLNHGSVYPSFSRKENASTETVKPSDTVLHVGLDFNITNMSAVIVVEREGCPHVVEEITKIHDTQAMIRVLQRRYPGKTIFVYPDASGSARKTSASATDITLLRNANLHVRVRSTNPLVRDRITIVNSLICNSKNERKLMVNATKCPGLVDALEQQAYRKGEPDKLSGFDHLVDSLGYLCAYRYPLTHHGSTTLRLTGV